MGGYSKKSFLIFSAITSILAIFPVILLQFVNELTIYTILLWILLFLETSLIPGIQGITIACLPKNIQGLGYSFVIFFNNLLGHFRSSPFDVNNPKTGNRIAQKITIWVTFSISICVGILAFIRFVKDEKYNEKMGRDKTIKFKGNDLSINTNYSDIENISLNIKDSERPSEIKQDENFSLF